MDIDKPPPFKMFTGKVRAGIAYDFILSSKVNLTWLDRLLIRLKLKQRPVSQIEALAQTMMRL